MGIGHSSHHTRLPYDQMHLTIGSPLQGAAEYRTISILPQLSKL